MKKRGNWPGINDPVRQALIDVERNASDALDAFEKSTRFRWRVVRGEASTQAQLWDLVNCAAPDCVVLLPPASALNQGAEICVAREATCTVGVLVKPVRGTVNGGTSVTGPSVNRLNVYVSTGKQWISA
jgi:hypothetical protein